MRALITDGVFPGVSSILLPLVDRLGLDLTIANSAEEVVEALPDVHLLIVKNVPLRAADIETARHLRGVQKLGQLLDSVDTEALKRRRIPFRTMRLPSAVAVADHTLALMLALSRQLIPATLAMSRPSSMEGIETDERRFAYNWAGLSAGSLAGKTLGLIGFGEVALEVATRAHAFGMKVQYTKRVPLPSATERRFKVQFATFDSLLEQSDVVSIHVPHTSETVGLIGAGALASMKPGALLINTARGAIVDENALVDSLRSGHLGGAGLDVFSVEPLPPDSQLLSAPRTVLTPHIAGAGSEALAQAIALCLANWNRTLKP
jgi:phosphoglycerate dehydrogenase-like enzyme